jgi:hypothetical protein
MLTDGPSRVLFKAVGYHIESSKMSLWRPPDRVHGRDLPMVTLWTRAEAYRFLGGIVPDLILLNLYSNLCTRDECSNMASGHFTAR